MISEYFTTAELFSQLAMFFSVEELEKIDFNQCLCSIENVDDRTRLIRVKERVFKFDIEFCDVEEVDV